MERRLERQTAILLRKRALEVAEMFSNKARGGNKNGETFHVRETIVLSDLTACVVFDKSSGKQAVAWFYYIPSHARPRWEYFFVGYSHLVGLERVANILHDIEQHNYLLNFEDINDE
jgi:hypothetical protein